MANIIKPFTKAQIEQYKKDPNRCPKCMGVTLKVNEDFNEESMSRKVECTNCGIQFHEVYKLITIEK